MNLQYSVVIEWSDEDEAYLVTLPEFGPDPQTHGNSNREAMKHAQEVMETLIEFYHEQGKALPEPKKYRPRKMRQRFKQEKTT
jgi:predicted RNase H-like HicB family nuclease